MISRKIWVTEKMSNFHTVVFFGPSSNCQWQPLFEEKRLLKVRPLRTPKIVLLLTFSDNGLIINQLNQPPLLIVPTKHFALICSAKSYVLFSALEKANITMLQKLSKCEVKAWLCWNLIILLWLPLRFYVKTKFGKFKRFKNVIFGNFRDWTLNFW